MPVAYQLRRFRENAFLSQQELAKRAHVHAKTVLRIEKLHPARASTLRRLAKVLRVDPRELTAPAP